MSWYYARGQEQAGPVEDAEFNRLVAGGQITAETLVWQQGMTDWQPYGQIAVTPQTAAAATPMFEAQRAPAVAGSGMRCVQCGRVFPESDLLEYQGSRVCAECKPIYFQRICEGVAPAFNYAGFWIRFAAIFLDGIIQWIVQIVSYLVLVMPFAFLSGATEEGLLVIFAVLAWYAFSLSFAIFYETWFIGKFGATPGKMACGLKVVKADGGPVTYSRALGRYFSKILSSMILCIGFIMAAFDDQKRALHDYICDTRVVRK